MRARKSSLNYSKIGRKKLIHKLEILISQLTKHKLKTYMKIEGDFLK